MEPLEKPLFGDTFSKTWATSEADEISSDLILPKNFSKDKGLISLFIVSSSGNVTVTPELSYALNQGGTSMSFDHGLSGYKTGGGETRVSTFNPNSESFECAIHQQLFYLPCVNGFKIKLTRASNVEVIFTYAGIHLFSDD